MPKTKVEVYDKDQLIYPYIENDHVTFSNGMKVSEMLDQSISMPTITHNETSFKVGVGDSDVSSSIVDSSVSKMVIKGQTYQNILPEPSTHVLTNNKEMFKVNEGLDPNVEIVDGVSKSAILSGQTLVNIVNGVNLGTGATETDNSYVLTQTNTNEELRLVLESSLIELNKDYTFIYYIQEKTTTKGNSLVVKNLSYLVPGNNTVITQNIGWNKVKFNVSSFGSNPRLNVAISSSEENGVYVKFAKDKFALLSGDWTQKELPFEKLNYGMQSVKMPVLKTIGKNLFDLSLMKQQPYVIESDTNSITIQNGGGRNVSEILGLKHKPNEQYTFTYERELISGQGYSLFIYVYTDGTQTSIQPNTINISDANKTIKHIILTYSDVGVNKLSNICLVKGANKDLIYEPYKSNILSTPSDLELRGIGEVQDTLDCLTGEVTERVGEIVLNGSEKWVINNGGTLTNTLWFATDKFDTIKKVGTVVNTDKLSYNHNLWNEDKEGIKVEGSVQQVRIRILKSKLTTQDINGFKQYLSQNPITVQYELATPIIKTVDLSSSGNWDKVVLNGNETWSVHSNWSGGEFLAVQTQVANKLGGGLAFTDSAQFKGMSWKDSSVNSQPSKECVRYDSSGAVLYVFIKKSRLTGETANDFKEWLQENPIAVWYQTATHQDSTQVKQPIFFKDGHIIQSSGANNSLIPTLNYQAKTSNSYVMDLMKTNTKYTMKAKSASGTFTIDGTSYGAGTNGTFTTPSSMTNKFLVMSNKTNEEVMILEGDVVSKTIPYFKGIKSAFEGESKIEVLSTGKNLWTATPYNRGNANYEILNNKDVRIYSNGVGSHLYQYFTYNAKPNTKYIISWESATVVKGHVRIIVRLANNGEVGTDYFTGEMGNSSQKKFTATFTTDSDVGKNGNVVAIGFYCYSSEASGEGDVTYHNIQIIESTQESEYEPYKSNSTKIPLLSPLRSLPNGVCDELIIDRESNKAKIIQRVGEAVLDGKEDWTTNSNLDSTETKFFYLPNSRIPNTWDRILPAWRCITNNRFVSTTERQFAVNQKIEWISGGDNTNGMIQILIKKERLSTPDVSGFKRWLSQNPTMVYYELETPTITEVDLEGFPYIYKDGHIFLNSEIVPTTEIIYSVNQCQQISASNEDIIRHEKELTYLQKLIAQYVQVDYESVLLSLKV